MFGLGFGEIILVLIIALVFIGPKKLPELAKGLGQGLREFQKAAKGFSDQLQEESKELEKVKEDILPPESFTTPHLADVPPPPENKDDASQQSEVELNETPDDKKENPHS